LKSDARPIPGLLDLLAQVTPAQGLKGCGEAFGFRAVLLFTRATC
jgi:hypothetical protein